MVQFRTTLTRRSIGPRREQQALRPPRDCGRRRMAGRRINNARRRVANAGGDNPRTAGSPLLFRRGAARRRAPRPVPDQVRTLRGEIGSCVRNCRLHCRPESRMQEPYENSHVTMVQPAHGLHIQVQKGVRALSRGGSRRRAIGCMGLRSTCRPEGGLLVRLPSWMAA
jgi:hypothetical protein